MIVSGKTIRQHHHVLKYPHLARSPLSSPTISPFTERTKLNGMSYGLSMAGYDVRLEQELDLEPGRFMLGNLIEHIEMPLDVVGIVHDKSTLARRGIAVQNTVIEPGWRGHLTIEVSNHGHDRVRLVAGSPIAQILFHRTDQQCEPYEGKYQDQPAAPVAAIMEE